MTSKHKSETPAKSNTTPTVGTNLRHTLLLEPKRINKSADAEGADGNGKASARNAFLVRMRPLHIDVSIIG